VKEEYLVRTTDELREVIAGPDSTIAVKVGTKIDRFCREYIEKAPLIFLATSDKNDKLDVSPKGDSPGFVKVLDENTILVPERPGNNLAFGFENILETGTAAIIFVMPGVKETVRVNGSAVISKDPELLEMLSEGGKSAILCTIIKVEECFFHCGKALIRSKLWNPNSWGDDKKSNMVKQLAGSFGMGEAILQGAIDDDYKNNL
jgi:PPOX class probable FMN-dependent enzyme